MINTCGKPECEKHAPKQKKPTKTVCWQSCLKVGKIVQINYLIIRDRFTSAVESI